MSASAAIMEGGAVLASVAAARKTPPDQRPERDGLAPKRYVPTGSQGPPR